MASGLEDEVGGEEKAQLLTVTCQHVKGKDFATSAHWIIHSFTALNAAGTASPVTTMPKASWPPIVAQPAAHMPAFPAPRPLSLCTLPSQGEIGEASGSLAQLCRALLGRAWACAWVGVPVGSQWAGSCDQRIYQPQVPQDRALPHLTLRDSTLKADQPSNLTARAAWLLTNQLSSRPEQEIEGWRGPGFRPWSRAVV